MHFFYRSERKSAIVRTSIGNTIFVTHAVAQLSDEQVIPHILKDRDLFAVLVQRYEEKLRRYIRRIIAVSEEDIEDILQEVFISVYRNLHGFDTSLSFSSWIYRIAHNYVRSLHRKRSVRPISVELTLDHSKTIADSIDIAKTFDQQVLSENIATAMAKLPDKYKEVLILQYLEQKDYNEIADIIKKPPGTVGTRINRAKKKLKALLAQLPESYDQ